MIKAIIIQFRKDLLIETRNKTAIFLSLSLALIVTISLSILNNQKILPSELYAELLWIVIFFSTHSILLHTFIREEDNNTNIILFYTVKPEVVFISKLIFNIIGTIVVSFFIVPLFIVLMNVAVKSWSILFVSIFCGIISYGSVATIVAALASKAGGREMLFVLIVFPLVLPILIINMKLTESVFRSGTIDLFQLVFLLAFSIGIILLSILLFPVIWSEQ